MLYMYSDYNHIHLAEKVLVRTVRVMRETRSFYQWKSSLNLTLYTLQEASLVPRLYRSSLFRVYSGYIRHGVSISLWELIWGV